MPEAEEQGNLPIRFSVRVTAYVVFLALLLIVYMAGLLTPLTPEDARRTYSKYFESLAKALGNVTSVDEACYRIFQYNAMVALASAAPGVGSLTAIYTQYTAGLTQKAIWTVEHGESSPDLGGVLTDPVLWLYTLSLAISASESLIAGYAMVRRRVHSEFALYLAALFLAISLMLFTSTLEAEAAMAVRERLAVGG